MSELIDYYLVCCGREKCYDVCTALYLYYAVCVELMKEEPVIVDIVDVMTQ